MRENPVTILYAYYDGLSKRKTASLLQRSEYIEARDAIAFAPIKFFQEISESLGLSLTDIISFFKNSKVVKFFSVIRWSFEKMYELLKKGYHAYIDLQKAIADYLSKTRVGKWTNEEIKKLDEFLKNHPKTKMLIGPGLGALLLFTWFFQAFAGDVEFDFDLSYIIQAIHGHFTFFDIFGDADGVRFLVAIFIGGAFKLTFPWPGPATIQFMAAVIYTIAKKVKQKLMPVTAMVHKIANRIAADIVLQRGLLTGQRLC
jgi:hypothetical protein